MSLNECSVFSASRSSFYMLWMSLNKCAVFFFHFNSVLRYRRTLNILLQNWGKYLGVPLFFVARLRSVVLDYKLKQKIVHVSQRKKAQFEIDSMPKQ